MRILLTGGTGNLGSEIKKHISCYAPTSDELDITNLQSCLKACEKYIPNIVIHCAGYVNSAEAEIEKDLCWSVNVVGTENMVEAFPFSRFIYISSDYVFDGEKGNYTEEDIPNPINFYGLTKLIAETIVKKHENSLILRAPFRNNPPWRFPKAFTDQYTSCSFVKDRAKDIVDVINNFPFTGILHIGGPRRSIYEMAKEASPDIGEMKRSEFPAVRIPRDTSLNSEKWNLLEQKIVQK